MKKKKEPLTRADRELIGALQEALDHAKSGKPLEERFTVRTYRKKLSPREYGAIDVRRLRERTGASQTIFAMFLGVTPKAVQNWEQGTKSPSSMGRRFMDELADNMKKDPDYFGKRLMETCGI